MAELPSHFGRRSVAEMYARVNEHRKAVAASGDPSVQTSWDAIEEFIDFAFARTAADRKEDGCGA